MSSPAAVNEQQAETPLGAVPVIGALPGPDARHLIDTAKRHGDTVTLVARNAERVREVHRLVSFFAPDLPVLTLPGWDCLPYDRVSPRADLMAERLEALAALSDGTPPSARILLTTANALVQRVPGRADITARRFAAEAGGKIDRDHLLATLARLGYRRVGTVMEPGDFAVRGGLIDVYPSGAPRPYRLDLFGDVLESLRVFDPLTQRSEGKTERMVLQPMSEIALDDVSVERFRTRFRQHFGTVTDDPLYEAISAKRPFPGAEHWLPLFVAETATLFDYLPAELPLVLDHGAEEAMAARHSAIGEQHRARQTAGELGAGFTTPYRALAPDMLYLSESETRTRVEKRTLQRLSPYRETGANEVIDLAAQKGRDFAQERTARDGQVFKAVGEQLRALRKRSGRALLAASSEGSAQRLRGVLKDYGVEHLVRVATFAETKTKGGPYLVVLDLPGGFEQPDLAIIAESDVFGDRLARPVKRQRRKDRIIDEVSALGEGDYVVHNEHGIGQYDGLVTLEIGGAAHDCLRVLYHDDDKLFVPVENLDVLSRYGAADGQVQRDRLGSQGWQNRKARVKQRIKEIADELIRIAAERRTRKGDRVDTETGLYDEFVARFPYDETDDQLSAIEATLEDLASGRPMDRLICGDVGFGKTEIALRAAFTVAASGKQVAVLAPTTLLVRQHVNNFRERFHGFPLKIAQLSRFVTGKAATEVKQGIKDGGIDIVIGTHALLGKNVEFKDLALVIVDEEQHFGVAHKERLKQLRAQVHVLTLTATPIPRTLQMALTGLRELSIIATPPVDRLAVNTFVMPADPVVIREAILREYYRGGQVFYVCPRVDDLPKVAEQLRELVPEVKLAIANGQMKAGDLDAVMTAFYEQKLDVLLSTNIVESGIDVPNANTLIVHRADMFGLSQLYQLRGRVGRAKQRGYAYFTLPPRKGLSELAEKRLSVIQSLDQLGAGFELASHDLDIRGSGNLLGTEQSGQIKEVGYELYNAMLQDAIKAAREKGEGSAGAELEEPWTPHITVDAAALIPDDYIADLDLRLKTYRRMAALADEDGIEGFAAELIDRFGPIPEETENLLQLVRIKQLCRTACISKVDAGPKGVTVAFHNNAFPKPERLVELLQKRSQPMKLRADHKLVVLEETKTAKQRLHKIERLVRHLAKLALD